MWNININSLLVNLWAARYGPFAYLDNFVVGVEARQNLETRAAEVTKILMEWCQIKKLFRNFEKS